jgi:hypothetical protein
MNKHSATLKQREAALRLRCAVQRGELARQVSELQSGLQPIDDMVATARGFLRRPVVIVGGAAALLLLGRTRAVRILRGGLVALATARQLRILLRL